MSMLKFVFIDRDGTLGGDGTSIPPNKFHLFPYAQHSLNLIKANNIKIFSLTNQPIISRSTVTLEEYETELYGFGFDDVFICPHGENDNCLCRKPLPGMLLDAQKKYNINFENAVVIGDGWNDMLAADAVGCRKILVKTGDGLDTLTKNRHLWLHTNADYVSNNLEEAVQWLTTLTKSDLI